MVCTIRPMGITSEKIYLGLGTYGVLVASIFHSKIQVHCTIATGFQSTFEHLSADSNSESIR